jgi:hypothetical protein
LTAAIGFPDLSLASLNGAMPYVGQTLRVCFTQPTPTQIKILVPLDRRRRNGIRDASRTFKPKPRRTVTKATPQSAPKYPTLPTTFMKGPFTV